MARILLFGVVAVAVVVVAVVAAVLLFLRQYSRPGEDTAQFIPSSAPLYVSVNLRPGMGQMRLARDVISLLETDDFIEKRDEMLEELEDATGIHFLDDVTTWLGTDVSFAVLDFDLDQPEWVLLAQVSDREAAAYFVKDMVSYLEDEFDAYFDSDTYGGADVWAEDRDRIALGLTDAYMLMGDSRDTVQDVIRNMRRPPSEPLADDEAFIAAQELVSAQRVMFAYARTEFVDTLYEAIDPYGDLEDSLRDVRRSIPEYVAASTSFVENGVRLDVAANTPSGTFTLDTENRLRSAKVLPEDTLILSSGVGVREAWEEGKKALGQDAYGALLEGFKDATGIDLERDVIESITGEVAFALLPSEVRFDQFGMDESGTIEALLMADVESPGGIENALDELAGILEDQGLDVDREPLGVYETVTATMDLLLGDYRPGYVVTEDWVVVGSNIDSLEEFYDAATGGVDVLSSEAEFARLAGMAPSPLHHLFFADMSGIIAMVENALGDELLSGYRRGVKPFVEPLNALMMTGSIADERMRFMVVLTLHE